MNDTNGQKKQADKKEEIIEEIEKLEEVEEELDETLDEVEMLKSQVEESEQKYRRALADYQNLEKRVQAQRREIILGANKDLLLRLLPILDTLQLASKHIKDQGIDVSVRQFLDILKNEGVTKIETVGKPFDPSIMEGITTKTGEENKVLEEVRAGYMLNDMLLRSAQVIVGNGEKMKN